MPRYMPENDAPKPSTHDTDTTAPSSDERTVADVVCRVCGESLNRFQSLTGGPGEHRHPHNAVKDHAPAPIPRAEAEFVVMYCDFCSSPAVEWTYQTRGELHSTLATQNFTSQTERQRIARDWAVVRSKEAPATDMVINTFSDRWTACARCAQFIEGRDVERLITHARRSNPVLARATRTVLRQVYAQFFGAIGPREPVTPSTPPTPPPGAGPAGAVPENTVPANEIEPGP